MGIIVSISVFIVGIIGAAMSRILADDFKEWVPYLTDRLIDLATRRMPAKHKERLDEEWRSHVNDRPGNLAKLVDAVGFLVAAMKIAPPKSEKLGSSIKSFITNRTTISTLFLFLGISGATGLVAFVVKNMTGPAQGGIAVGFTVVAGAMAIVFFAASVAWGYALFRSRKEINGKKV